MSDAQAEAERIVQRVAGDRVKFGPVAALFTDKHDAERVLNIERDRLVAALAAAIEVAERVDMSPTRRGHMPDKASTRQLLAAQVEALSALRQTDGEDT